MRQQRAYLSFVTKGKGRKTKGKGKKKSRKASRQPSRFYRPKKGQPVLKLFADESGNEGSNWNGEQPFHVAAGWLLPAADVPRAHALVEKFVAQRQAKELKAAKLLKSERGIRICADIITELQGFAVPFFILVHRLESVSLKVVETLLDPTTNPGARWLPNDAFLQRNALAQELLGLVSAESLAHFAGAYRRPSPEVFAESASRLAREVACCTGTGFPELVNSLRSAARFAESICREENLGDDHARQASLSIPAFGHFVKKVDSFVLPQGCFTIVHDRTDYADAYRSTLSLLQAIGNRRALGERGHAKQMGTSSVVRFMEADSLEEPAIQAADVLAGSVCHIAKRGGSPPRWSLQERRLGQLLVPMLVDREHHGPGLPNPLCAGYMGPERELQMIAKRAFDESI